MKNVIVSGLLGLALFTSPSYSLALDASTFVERYADFAKSIGQPFSHGEITEDGDTIVVKGAVWSIKDVPPMKATSLKFTNVTETDGGGYSIGRIVIQTFSVGADGFSFTFDNASMDGLKIPAEGESDPYKKIMLYTQFVINKSKVSVGGLDVFTMDGLTTDISPFDTATPMKMTMGTTGLAVDVSAIPDPQFKQSLQMLGYDGKFSGNITLNGTWSPADGNMIIGTYDMKIDNVGTISMPMSFGGYTAETLVAIQEKSAEINTMNNANERMMASIDLFKELSFGGMTIRFTNDSIAERVLKVAAQQMGQTPVALVQAAPFMLGQAMEGFPIPALKDKITAAVTAFLQNPKSIEISAKPDKPVGFGELMQAGMSNPFALVDLLKVDIQANN